MGLFSIFQRGRRQGAPQIVEPAPELVIDPTPTGEVLAAIAAAIALALHNEGRHIEEPGFITIVNSAKLNRR